MSSADKVALVTGAGSGIGRAVALALMRRAIRGAGRAAPGGAGEDRGDGQIDRPAEPRRCPPMSATRRR